MTLAKSTAETPTQNQTTMESWHALCEKQGWNEKSKIIHLEGFIQCFCLSGLLMAYAESVVKEAGELDYVLICADNDISLSQSQDEETLDMWNWRDNKGNCSEISFETEALAAENAVAWLESYSNNIS